MEHKAAAGMAAGADLARRGVVGMGARAKTRYRVECVRDGKIAWVEEFDNLVVNEGLDDILDKYFKGSSYTASHFVGLKGAGAVAATDTLDGSPTNAWSELTPYSGNRPGLTMGTVSGQSVDNSASKASFSITSSETVAGAFVATSNSGTSGTLYGAGDFSSSRDVENGDTLNVTITATQAAA